MSTDCVKDQPDFTKLVPISSDYATLPITQGFNWDACFKHDHVGEWYLVVFRSILKPTYDEGRLNEADRRALAEARTAPGFMYYFCGTPAANGQCLSLCLWNSQQEAREASSLPAHHAVLALVQESYQFYKIELYRVIKKPGITAPEIISYH